jgi:hypothetical protein
MNQRFTALLALALSACGRSQSRTAVLLRGLKPDFSRILCAQ